MEAQTPPATGKLGNSLSSVLVRTVRAEYGPVVVDQMLREAGCTRDVAYLEDESQWLSLSEAMALLETGTRLTGDPLLARRVGEGAVRRHAGSAVATLLRSLGSPQAVLQQITLTAGKFSTVTDMSADEVGDGFANVIAVARPGFSRHPLHCEWARGLLSTPPMLFGLPPARVEETECQARGGSACRYRITWDAAAAASTDPEQRVTALEGQLVAMTDRLTSVFANAAELVSPDDLDTVLARIVDRAASEVRATGYLLSLRRDGEADPTVYSHGLQHDDALRIAREAAAGEPPPGHRIVAEVASSRRHHGHLVVTHADGMQFFSQEHQLMRLYAKHAAAVLDMAMALNDAQLRHAQVSALLELSQSLAAAGGSAEVAKRLAEAVLKVVDADGMSAWVWDAGEEIFQLAATAGAGSHHGTKLDQLRLSARETPVVRRLVEGRRPVRFDASTDEPFIQAAMEFLGLTAIVAVPIIARDELLGLLIVSVAEHPERLHMTPELLQRLQGVAAQAATALQNGRLVDELDRRATHDDLTGVLNRAGFGARMRHVLDDAEDGEERVGLLFVDLDGFKPVNDEHGHDTGDELLRQAAARLRGLLRHDDIVARLGGDEFGLVLARVRTDDETAAAAQRVRAALAEPFLICGREVRISASVGTARWPDDGATVEALMRCADGEMYASKSARVTR